MKFILILVLPITATQAAEPKFCKGDIVHYKVSHFYSKVCRGTGTIEQYWLHGDGIAYLIKNEPGCPDMDIREEDIIEEIKK